MTGLIGITIDGPSTKDIDDGISVKEVDSGHEVVVAIADVARRVRLGSPQDEEAKKKVASRYFATGNKPMLPRYLSEDGLSLLPEQERRVLAARIFIGERGIVRELRDISLATFTSRARIDYGQIPSILQEGKDPEINILAALSMTLLDLRRESGALAVYDLNDGWVTTEEGFVRQLKDVRETVGYIIVQEMMILANSLIAEWCVKENIPVLFRNHTARVAAPPAAEVQQEISQFMKGPWKDFENVRKRVNMFLNRADYGVALRGHYGLSLPAYLHFTSPIRRYADLVNHRQIRAKLKGEKLPHTAGDLIAIATHINAVEEAERDGASTHFKGQAEARATRALDRGILSHMNDRELERAMKVEANSEQDTREALVREVSDRLEKKTLPIICMTVSLFIAPHGPEFPKWRDIQERILAFLVENPEISTSIWTMAEVICEVEEIMFEESRIGPPHALRFLASARSGNVFTLSGRDYNAKNAKLARQRASVALLFAYLDIQEGPVWLDADYISASVTSKEPPKSFKIEGRDPISALQEYCQQRNLGLPNYSFLQEGLSHAPKITCTGNFNGIQGRGIASNKQDAKRSAAADIISKIH
jgi:ribonuclease R